jgi:hypothetical protein
MRRSVSVSDSCVKSGRGVASMAWRNDAVNPFCVQRLFAPLTAAK